MTALTQTPPVQPLSITEMGKVCAEHAKYGYEDLKDVLGEFAIGTLRASANLVVEFARKGFTIVNAFMAVCKEYAEVMIRRVRARNREAEGMGTGGRRSGGGGGQKVQPQKTPPTLKAPKASMNLSPQGPVGTR